jgi:hypothetical protein
MDPYSAIVNDKSQPSYDDDALNLSDLPAFDVHLPSSDIVQTFSLQSSFFLLYLYSLYFE